MNYIIIYHILVSNGYFIPVCGLHMVKARSDSTLFYLLRLKLPQGSSLLSNSWLNEWLMYNIYYILFILCITYFKTDTVTLNRSYNQPTWREGFLTQSEFFSIKEMLSFMSLLRFGFNIKTLTSVRAGPALFFSRHLFASFISTSVFSGTQVLF